MPFFQRLRKTLSAFFLIIYCVFSTSAISPSSDAQRTNSSAKYFSIPLSAAWVVREEASEFSSQVIKDSCFIIQLKAGELIFRNKLFSNDALRIPLGSFNPFYTFVSIHAP